MRSIIIWAFVIMAVFLPLILAAISPLLAWRDPVYMVGGFAGVFAMTLLFIQPVLAAGLLPGINRVIGWRIHQGVGIVLLVTIVSHVAGLWITSPPDVIDALLFRSATSFSIWGVVAMWTVFIISALVASRKTFSIPPRIWKVTHRLLAATIVITTIVHAGLIEGTMESVSKYALSILILSAACVALTNNAAKKPK